MNWIKTSDRLPEDSFNVLFRVENDSEIVPGYFSSECFREDKKVVPVGKKYKTLDVYKPGFISAYDNCCWETIRFEVNEVTHWLPITEIPLPEEAE